MGVSAIKPVLRNIENSLRNLRKTLEKPEFTDYVFCQYLGTNFYEKFEIGKFFNLK